MEKIAELENGLILAKVSVDELKEQDLNARFMDKNTFERLKANIQKGNRLEQLPFCAQTNKGIEIISGHHRIRACRMAGVTEIFIVLDVSGLNRSQILSKQLSHNSIMGRDDLQTLKKIYDQITDIDLKIEAYIDESLLKFETTPMNIPELELNYDYRHVSIMFMPKQKEEWDKAIKNLIDYEHEFNISTRKEYDDLISIFHKVMKKEKIINTATLFTKIASIVNEYYSNKEKEEIKKEKLEKDAEIQ